MKVFEFTIYSYIAKKYNDMFDELIKKYHITQIEINVLAFLANNPEYQHAQDIVNIRGISKGHASIAIEKLVQKELITRQCDPQNRRCNILLITDKATDLIKEIQDIQKQFTKLKFSHLTQEEITIYQNILTKIYKNLGGYVDE